MFDVGAAELLVIVVVAILVIGPKDMPAAMRTAGRWIGKLRRISSHFRSGIDEMVRQAEIEDMEEKWSQRNKEIMAKYPTGGEPEGGAPEYILPAGEGMEPLPPRSDPAVGDTTAEAAVNKVDRPASPRSEPARTNDEPGLPFDEDGKDR
ncbi:Sec-independent protein translocase protein TatB [Qipengyuania flava]|nr:Sec-independent protein translocase protein TatB [Qipengyuania flava]